MKCSKEREPRLNLPNSPDLVPREILVEIWKPGFLKRKREPSGNPVQFPRALDPRVQENEPGQICPICDCSGICDSTWLQTRNWHKFRMTVNFPFRTCSGICEFKLTFKCRFWNKFRMTVNFPFRTCSGICELKLFWKKGLWICHPGLDPGSEWRSLHHFRLVPGICELKLFWKKGLWICHPGLDPGSEWQLNFPFPTCSGICELELFWKKGLWICHPGAWPGGYRNWRSTFGHFRDFASGKFFLKLYQFLKRNFKWI